MISLLTGSLVVITFLIIGVRMAVVFGVLTFLLNYIPNIGSMIALCLPIPIIIIVRHATPRHAIPLHSATTTTTTPYYSHLQSISLSDCCYWWWRWWRCCYWYLSLLVAAAAAAGGGAGGACECCCCNQLLFVLRLLSAPRTMS